MTNSIKKTLAATTAVAAVAGVAINQNTAHADDVKNTNSTSSTTDAKSTTPTQTVEETQKQVDDAKSTVSADQTAVNQAQSNVDTKQDSVNTAQKTVDDAANAKQKVTDDQTAVDNQQKTVDSTKSTADAAQTTVDNTPKTVEQQTTKPSQQQVDDSVKATQDAQTNLANAKTAMENAQQHAADLQKQADAGNHDMERATAQQAVTTQQGVVNSAQTTVQQAQSAVDAANAAYQAAQTGTTDSSKQATIAQQLNALNNLKSQLSSLKNGDYVSQQQALQTAITNLTNLQNQLNNTPKQIASGSTNTSTSTGTPAQYNTAANQTDITTGVLAGANHQKQIYISGTAVDFSKYASDPAGTDFAWALYNAWNAAASDSDKITGDRMSDDQLREFNNYALQQIQKYREASGFNTSTLAANQNVLNATNARSTDTTVLDMRHDAASTKTHFANTQGAGTYASESLGQSSMDFGDGSTRFTTMAQAKVVFDSQLEGMINNDADANYGHRDMLLANNSNVVYAAVLFYDPAKQVFNVVIDSSVGAQGNVNGTPSGTFTDDPTTPTMVDNPAYAALQNQVNSAQSTKNAAQSAFDSTNSRISDLQNQVNSAQSTYDASNAAGTVVVDQSKVASTKATVDSANQALTNAKTTLSTEQSKLTDLQNKLAAIPANTTLTDAQQADLANANKAMNDANAAYTSAYSALDAAIANYNKVQAALKADGQPVQIDNPAYAVAQQALAAATQTHQNAVNKLADLQKQLADDTTVSDALQAQVADAQKVVTEGQTELVALHQALRQANEKLTNDQNDLSIKQQLLDHIKAIEAVKNDPTKGNDFGVKIDGYGHGDGAGAFTDLNALNRSTQAGYNDVATPSTTVAGETSSSMSYTSEPAFGAVKSQGLTKHTPVLPNTAETEKTNVIGFAVASLFASIALVGLASRKNQH